MISLGRRELRGVGILLFDFANWITAERTGEYGVAGASPW
jgi:hypothetical protein